MPRAPPQRRRALLARSNGSGGSGGSVGSSSGDDDDGGSGIDEQQRQRAQDPGAPATPPRPGSVVFRAKTGAAAAARPLPSFPLTVPLLPFPPGELLVPGATKVLHLYEARYLALLER